MFTNTITMKLNQKLTKSIFRIQGVYTRKKYPARIWGLKSGEGVCSVYFWELTLQLLSDSKLTVITMLGVLCIHKYMSYQCGVHYLSSL